MAERLRELTELQDGITARRRDAMVGREVDVLVDAPGVGRSHREAPEIDGIVAVPDTLEVGTFATVTITGAAGPDLEAAWREATSSCASPSGKRARSGRRPWPRRPTPSPSRLLLAPVMILLILDRPASWSTLASGSCCRAPTASTASWPGARARPARVPSSTRSPTRCLVLGAMVALVAKASSGGCRSPSSAVREIGISAYRSYVGRKGVSVPARKWAKVKTVVQEVAVGFALLPLTAITAGSPTRASGSRSC